MVTEYDKTSVYKKQIVPLIEDIVKVCTKEKIPMFISLAPKSTTDETTYYNDGVLTGSLGITLHEDEFEKYLGVLHGGKITFPGGDPELSEGKLFDYIASSISNTPSANDDPEDDEDFEEVMTQEDGDVISDDNIE